MSDNYWNKVRNSGLGGYGYGNDKFSKVKPTRHFARARAFAFGGSGANREALQNSIGMITKKQIEFANKQTGIFGKALGYGGTLAIPGFQLYMMNEAVKEGQTVGQYATETIAPQVGMFYGGRVGANLGAGIQKAAGGNGIAAGLPLRVTKKRGPVPYPGGHTNERRPPCCDHQEQSLAPAKNHLIPAPSTAGIQPK